MYFTDPPYGLPGYVDDPNREIDFFGVFRVTPEGEVTLITDELQRPNGIALSPDEQTLYVSNSQRGSGDNATWTAWDLNADGTIDPDSRRTFFDAEHLATRDRPGAPDGMKFDVHGNLWATGPGGVLILSPEGDHLGTILTGRPTANVAWGDDGSTLYITANQHLIRIRTSTVGAATPGADFGG